MKKICYALPILLLINRQLYAQNLINTDRPDQSDGTHIVETHYVQVETGVQFSRQDDITKGFDNVTLIRYGITRKFEVRLLNQYSSLKDSARVSGVRPPAISFKNQLCTQRGLLPKITLVSYFRLPVTVSKDFKAEHVGYTFTLALRRDFTHGFKVYSNFGVTQDQQSTDISYLGTLEANYNITAKLATFAEYYGSYGAHVSATNGVDIGFIYALKNNLAIDISFGSPASKPGVNRFVSSGVSIRLPG